MARLGGNNNNNNNKKSTTSKKKKNEKEISSNNSTNNMNNNDDETTKNNIVVNSQTKKSIKIYKKLTIKQAQKIDALKRRKQIVQTTKQTNTFVGKLKEDIHSIYNNAQKHQKIVKKSIKERNENLKQKLKPQFNSEPKKSIPWKPTPSNTVNVLFDGKPKVHKPFDYKSILEWEELLYLSPRTP